MKNLTIYNGGYRQITVITNFGAFAILSRTSAVIEVDEWAEFNQSDFHVQEIGNWHLKTEHCATGCDAEIYDAELVSANPCAAVVIEQRSAVLIGRRRLNLRRKK